MFLENKSDRIIKGIFIGGILYFIGHVLIFLTTLSSTTSEIGYYITVGTFYLGSLCKPIGIIVIFKFLCDIVYKVLKALDKYNNEQY
ncbi:MAG: hypothetical protein E7C49_00275 [Clostridium sp.]|nr:hypothetical protein [Clostridium sp.]